MIPARRAALALTAAILLSGLTMSAPSDDAPVLVPWPRSLVPAAGRMPLTTSSRIVARNKALLPLARILVLGDEQV